MAININGTGSITGLSSISSPTISGGSVPLGDATAPGIVFSGDPNTGIYSPGADQVAISTGGSGRLFVDASGNVGVGISAPTFYQGSGLSIRRSGTATLRLEDSGLSTSEIKHADGTGLIIETLNNRPILFSPNATERLRVTSAGLVGIGTSVPQGLVSLSKGTGNTAPTTVTAANSFINIGISEYGAASNGKYMVSYGYSSGATNAPAYIGLEQTSTGSYTCGDLTFYTRSVTTDTAPTERLRITNAGNVGIGTTGPDQLLVVSQNVASYNPAIKISNPNTGRWGGRLVFESSTGTGLYDAAVIKADGGPVSGGGNLIFEIAGTERCRVDNSGRLLVGTSSSVSSSSDSKLELVQDGSATAPHLTLANSYTTPASGDPLGLIRFYGKAGNAYEECARISARYDGAPGSGDKPGRLEFSTTADGASSPTERFTILNSGHFKTGTLYNRTSAVAANVYVDSDTSLYRATSSGKYKTDVETLEDKYADALLACRPVWYRSLCEGDNPSHGWWGFIAEEVAEIDPRLVHWKTTEISYDDNGSMVETPCEPEPEGVQYDRFVPHLLNLIKRQKEQIEAMEARLTALESV